MRWEAGVQATLSLSGLGQAPHSPGTSSHPGSHMGPETLPPPPLLPCSQETGSPSCCPSLGGWVQGAGAAFPTSSWKTLGYFCANFPGGGRTVVRVGPTPVVPALSSAAVAWLLRARLPFLPSQGRGLHLSEEPSGLRKGDPSHTGAHAAFVWRCQGLPTVSPRPGLGGWGSQEPSQLGLAPRSGTL